MKVNLLMNAVFCSKDSWKNVQNTITLYFRKNSSFLLEELEITLIKCYWDFQG